MENYRRIKDGNGRLTLEEVKVRRIWKKYFEGLCNKGNQEQVEVYMHSFDVVR